MTLRERTGLVVLWALSLGATAAWTTERAQQSVPPGVRPGETIVTGENLGFRLEGRRGTLPIGTLMVRIDGIWMEAQHSLKMVPVR